MRSKTFLRTLWVANPLSLFKRLKTHVKAFTNMLYITGSRLLHTWHVSVFDTQYSVYLSLQ